MKKAPAKRPAPKTKAKSRTARKTPITPSTVKKKVVKKLKDIGAAAARAALDELLPEKKAPAPAPTTPAAAPKRPSRSAASKSR